MEDGMMMRLTRIVLDVMRQLREDQLSMADEGV